MRDSNFFSLSCILLLIFSIFAVSQPVMDGNWPSFRGRDARGIADGQNPPVSWSVETGENIAWRTPIPGLGHSSPVIWGNKIFITTAVGKDEQPYLKIGLYGESPDNPEKFDHKYILYCIDKKSGEILWQQTAFTGIPQVERHVKSSHATCTPVVDGRYVLAFFGSEGLYCYALEGGLKWKKDFGYLDAGAFDSPSIQWGFGSSPVIYKDMVLVVCDVNNQSFITALDVKTGREIWRTDRDEYPGWGSPTVHVTESRAQVLVNGYKHIGGYDLETGKELWKMSGGGDIPIPTPIVAHDLVYITNAHGRMRPIYAIKLDAVGDITLANRDTSNQYIAWARLRRGCYIPTPLVYGDYLYILNMNGILTNYDAKTGKQIYRELAGKERSAFSASPVASDGRMYVSSEYGDIHVIKLGPEYEHLATNKMNEICMATPAISEKMIFIRTANALYGIREGSKSEAQQAKEPETGPEKQKEAFKPPTGELTNPVEILRAADRAAEAVSLVQYNISVKAMDAAKDQIGEGTATVIIGGVQDYLPKMFYVDGQINEPGASAPAKFTAGCDGNQYWVIDYEKRTVHVDLDFAVMGKFSRTVYGAFVREFFIDGPFQQEINGSEVTLLGTETVEGIDCYEIFVNYGDDQQSKATFCFSKSDFLPRSRKDIFNMQDGQQGGTLTLLTNVNPAPDLEPDLFKVKVPEGFSKTGQPAQ
ncbi:PQQ-binding-like beta-propeller repeat protein [candidate division KSB1 bacterium]|nr:PQQ-binding-like beta-propeller repeat protein [candidate division KSB1 bacterium]